jgi:serine/threonine-protein kinase RsbW
LTAAVNSPQPIDQDVRFSLRIASSEARKATTWLNEACTAQNIPADSLWRLDLCVTEALANVLAHGGAAAGASPIELLLHVRRGANGGGASVTISDAGNAFDPLTAPVKPRARSLAEAEPGGQGLPMLRRFADALNYSHEEGRNHLTIQVRWPETAS